MIRAYQLVVLAPYAAALVLVAIPGYRVGAVLNVLASAATLAAGSLATAIGAGEASDERRRLAISGRPCEDGPADLQHCRHTFPLPARSPFQKERDSR